MKKFFLMGIMVCLAMVANAQRSMEWYSYWGSNDPGNQIEPQRMVVDKDGNIYVAALFGGSKVDVQGATLNSNSSMDKGDAVIVKMNANKEVQWTYSVVEAGNATVSGIALDKKGNVIVLGAFNKKIRVGDDVMELDDSNWGDAAVYVLKLAKDGSALKAWQIPALKAVAGKVAVDSKNDIVITGLLSGDAIFEPDGDAEGDSDNNSQLFVAKYDADGNHLWHQFRNDEGAVSTYGAPSLAVDESDNIYVASSINGKTSFMGNELNVSTNSPFILSYNAAGKERWYHVITGSRSDVAVDVAVSPIGQVAMAINNQSADMQIDGAGSKFTPEYNSADGAATRQHTAVYTFALSGEFQWWYYWGWGSVVPSADELEGKDGAKATGSDAICHSIHCTDEGVWYISGMMTGRYGGKRLADNTLADGRNSGVEAVDHQWIQHNTNGGQDAYLITLTRSGELANALRPGGIQYERGIDMALSPDKKSLYFLMAINVRDQAPYTCPDNLFDSWSDIDAKGRIGKYTVLNVFCPENGKKNPYTLSYKNNFSSAMLVKYAMPAIDPNELPYFVLNEPYSQSIVVANPQGKASIFQLGQYGDVEFDGETVSGTFANDRDRYVGIIAIDSIALPGDITYYEYDDESHANHRSVRSTPRNVRYLPLTTEENAKKEEEGIEPVMAGTLKATMGRKMMRNGILYIERNGILYNAQGAQVR